MFLASGLLEVGRVCEDTQASMSVTFTCASIFTNSCTVIWLQRKPMISCWRSHNTKGQSASLNALLLALVQLSPLSNCWRGQSSDYRKVCFTKSVMFQNQLCTYAYRASHRWTEPEDRGNAQNTTNSITFIDFTIKRKEEATGEVIGKEWWTENHYYSPE